MDAKWGIIQSLFPGLKIKYTAIDKIYCYQIFRLTVKTTIFESFRVDKLIEVRLFDLQILSLIRRFCSFYPATGYLNGD